MIPWFYLYRGDDVFILEVFIKVLPLPLCLSGLAVNRLLIFM